MMKRFWLFAFDGYYPSGGLCDLVGCYDTLDEAKAAAFMSREFRQIIDTATGYAEEWYWESRAWTTLEHRGGVLVGVHSLEQAR